MRLKSVIVAFLFFAHACTVSPAEEKDPPSLRATYATDFKIGAAIGTEQFLGRIEGAIEVVTRHFNSVTPENLLKWEVVHPEPDKYDFALADKFVAFGSQNKMEIIGHTLVWHDQVPEWVFEDELGKQIGRDDLLDRMREHIHTVVGRYKGKIDGWDVVNEALNEDGSMRQSKWLEIIGEDYIEHAFRFAHEADPDAELYYNDYSLLLPAKRDGAIQLVRTLQKLGCRIDGIGIQAHWLLEDGPELEEVDEALRTYSTLGVKVMITELDVSVLHRPEPPISTDALSADPQLNPYRNGLPDHVQKALAQRYADLFRLFLEHRNHVSRVTFWGIGDGETWLNGWPISGRTDYPLLFDHSFKPKPAFWAVIEARARLDK